MWGDTPVGNRHAVATCSLQLSHSCHSLPLHTILAYEQQARCSTAVSLSVKVRGCRSANRLIILPIIIHATAPNSLSRTPPA